MPILTGFGPNPRGPKSGQGKLADLDALILYLHHLTLRTGGVPNLKGYQPAISGSFSTQGAGVRTAWLA